MHAARGDFMPLGPLLFCAVVSLLSELYGELRDV